MEKEKLEKVIFVHKRGEEDVLSRKKRKEKLPSSGKKKNLNASQQESFHSEISLSTTPNHKKLSNVPLKGGNSNKNGGKRITYSKGIERRLFHGKVRRRELRQREGITISLS